VTSAATLPRSLRSAFAVSHGLDGLICSLPSRDFPRWRSWDSCPSG
jgi:hypothetical protein